MNRQPTQGSDPDEFIDVPAVAKILGVHPRTVSRLMASRSITFYKIGSGEKYSCVRFKRGDVERYLRHARVEATRF